MGAVHETGHDVLSSTWSSDGSGGSTGIKWLKPTLRVETGYDDRFTGRTDRGERSEVRAWASDTAT
ncbi:hypothetical protein MLP_20000 [Microlunatus phosphovorus NM-1]|uniref:Uncharacterized protein n=1 Tax=Microlunatus phosphovorus (strain ATCC 700054 / DSM 10555 / JCM 9379 / NBRC 101784 / NCIMB 13414 / VKM Ac-1990 / NM-1) TaxID=1032480 RepID=F5XTE2_MICPN|nr:hypothetical protein MLP_20000 [Microlunatus phosphovorus NM-1]